VAFDVDATLDKVERLATDADTDLVVFPEAFVSCYPRGHTFGNVIGTRSARGCAWFRRYWDSSIDVPGPATDRLAAIAGVNPGATS
jgi:predicted amidohydrolase